MSVFINYSVKSKFYDDYNKVVVGKMKDETSCIPIKECFVLKSKIYKFWENDNS